LKGIFLEDTGLHPPRKFAATNLVDEKMNFDECVEKAVADPTLVCTITKAFRNEVLLRILCLEEEEPGPSRLSESKQHDYDLH
jgi:hypothetical protein